MSAGGWRAGERRGDRESLWARFRNTYSHIYAQTCIYIHTYTHIYIHTHFIANPDAYRYTSVIYVCVCANKVHVYVRCDRNGV